eukprot:TRINITY_DN4991_c0_g2_i2.p1 TRINITY_DN4991_c0_g2~~TRINITY_DN4991_c0_g2_i2.p1  ORF type:complete len:232 (+),score=46.45 TRINITY_DN4991_c0_g2_i2:735-1430(+)
MLGILWRSVGLYPSMLRAFVTANENAKVNSEVLVIQDTSKELRRDDELTVTPQHDFETDIDRWVRRLKAKERRDQPVSSLFNPKLLELPNVFIQDKRWKGFKDKVKVPPRKLQYPPPTIDKSSDITRELIPRSPKLGPFEIAYTRTTKSYYWCSCGLSGKQPFCDGMHFGTRFRPLKFRLAEAKRRFFLCGCKLTKEAPFCDGETCIMARDELMDKKSDAAEVQGEIEDKL